jgi:hypothetical protein
MSAPAHNNHLKSGSDLYTFAPVSIHAGLSEELLDLLRLRAMQGLLAAKPFFSSVWIKASFLLSCNKE